MFPTPVLTNDTGELQGSGAYARPSASLLPGCHMAEATLEVGGCCEARPLLVIVETAELGQWGTQLERRKQNVLIPMEILESASVHFYPLSLQIGGSLENKDNRRKYVQGVRTQQRCFRRAPRAKSSG
jgi:hypothetical protein